ncbi:MAG: phosphopantothenoylcysteine decarboxylase [Candidatus Omnitrophica bacterium]|nr:phosphopantothenoylcysteine decarboxylase [Candidatus Omnitrophota bacterium]
MRRRPLRVLISAGPTREPIDPVRFLSNYSTGYMGAQLATQALARGHRVTVVTGPVREPMPAGARVIPVERAQDMAHALQRRAPRADVVMMAAAIADFRPVRRAARKLPRARTHTLRLTATPDIVGGLPRHKGQLIVGFALETGSVLARAVRKLRTKRLDVILAQAASARQTPFGRTRVRAWLVERNGVVTPLGRCAKPAIARVLLDKVEGLWYGQASLRAHR